MRNRRTSWPLVCVAAVIAGVGGSWWSAAAQSGAGIDPIPDAGKQRQVQIAELKAIHQQLSEANQTLKEIRDLLRTPAPPPTPPRP